MYPGAGNRNLANGALMEESGESGVGDGARSVQPRGWLCGLSPGCRIEDLGGGAVRRASVREGVPGRQCGKSHV